MSSGNTDSGSAPMYICIKQFSARLGDELNMKIGDKIEVLADDREYNDGWYMGKNIMTGEVGLYPKSFTQILQENKSEGSTLLRSRSRRIKSNKGGEKVSSTTDVESSMKNLDISSQSQNGAQPKSTIKSSSENVYETLNDIDKALRELQTEGKINTPDLHHNKEVQKTVTEEKKHNRTVSSSSITDDLNPREVLSWTPRQVSSYFAMILGFDMDVAGKFARHKITGQILTQLDLTYLKELDIDSFGTRFEIFKEIEKLKEIAKGANKGKSMPGDNISSKQDFYDGHNMLDYDSTPPVDLEQQSPYNVHSSPNNSDEDRNLINDENQRGIGGLLPPAELLAYTPSKSGNSIYHHSRKLSKSNAEFSSGQESPSADLFASPRKAPKPPKVKPFNLDLDQARNEKDYDSAMASPGTPKLYMTRRNASSVGLVHSRQSSSIYDKSINGNKNVGSPLFDHRRNSSYISNHKRDSSLFADPKEGLDGLSSRNMDFQNKRNSTIITSPYDSPRPSESSKSPSKYYSTSSKDFTNVDTAMFSPKKLESSRSPESKSSSKDKLEKRSVSESSTLTRLKTLRTTSTQNFRSLTGSKKSKTSAFTEGIRHITPDEAIKSAKFSGWMSKRSGNNLGWRSRYFTLHGTRLSYFTSLKDKKERGLIDITAHKVIPVNSESDSNDKYISMYVSTAGFGRFCFKLVPPAPGFKKGLTFTQPKVHYFAVETEEEMRGWLKAIMTSTIDIDDSVPVVSSCNTRTVTLQKAQELLAQAREETKLRDEMIEGHTFDSEKYDDYDFGQMSSSFGDTSEENSPSVLSRNDSTFSRPPNTKLAVDTSVAGAKPSLSPRVNSQSGFASPYLLASGLLSPRSATSGQPSTPNGTSANNETNSDGSSTNITNAQEQDSLPKSKSNKNEKFLAYSKDGTFVIKPKFQG